MSSIYQTYSKEQVDELLSNFLIDRWSYSRVNTFARNEKEFEMRYLYYELGKSSSTTIAGQAYHKALELYFRQLQYGVVCDIVDMQQEAFNHISEIKANVWKLSKTRPTIQDCINHATETANKGINNFLAEIDTYISEIKEVLGVELKLQSWLTINGVDIPLPCSLVIDLSIITNEDKRVIIDHKLRSSFTDEKDMKFVMGKQAITYAKGYESIYDETIDEVWIIENKTSKNKDGSPQLAVHKCVMDADTRRLYEAILYEPLSRMIRAVNDSDYVYLINDNDNLTDKAEIYEFWAKTMIAEVEDFNIPENKKELIQKRLKKIRDASLSTITPKVVRNFKKFTEQFIPYDLTNKDMTNEQKIEHVLRSFGIVAKVQHTFDGYSSSSYLLEMSAGISISNVNKYRLDIANALNVPNVRIQKDLFVYDGKSYLAIESGKKSNAILAWDKTKLEGYRIPIGIDNFQRSVIWNMDNHSTPHMLICGATGSGKSVSIKSTIEYVLTAGIHEVYIFDPKFEFTSYRSNPRVWVVNDIENIEREMKKLVEEMESRVKKSVSHKTLIVFDEFADAVANSRKGNELKKYEMVEIGCYQNGRPKMKRQCVGEDKSLEENLRILLQKGRSSGFRIIAATQRASTKVITGDAKVNFPVQVCFRVPKDIDSIVVIDEPGAEALNGRGDGLIKSPEYMGVVRFQAFYKE
ncbi:MAG: DUF87 domain-containing protein [Prevotella sp.]|jgi:hypothetical protein|nr:DUF87 domain-containing protein [Prevotella sp.]